MTACALWLAYRSDMQNLRRCHAYFYVVRGSALEADSSATARELAPPFCAREPCPGGLAMGA